MYASINPIIAPPILEKKPKIIVKSNNFSNIPVIFNIILNTKYNIENITKNAINSYKIILYIGGKSLNDINGMLL